MRLLILLALLFVLYADAFHRGSRAAQAAIESWTQCLVDLNHSNDTAKEAIELARSCK